MNKINKFLSSRTKTDWLQIFAWISTFVLLLAFIFVRLYQTQHVKVWGNAGVNAVAASALAFTIALFSSLLTTVIIQFRKRKAGK